jgi:hypothetical protein
MAGCAARTPAKMMRLTLLSTLLLLPLCQATAQVRVWQGTLSLPTYEEAAPDPNPPFDQYANDRFNYPYTLRTNLTDKRADHVWRALFLENEYLKCLVLPDLGGHVYTCTDKRAADVLCQPVHQKGGHIVSGHLGGVWNRIQFSGLAQLGESFSRRFCFRAKGGRQRVCAGGER